MSLITPQSPFFHKLHARIDALGGLLNGHMHLDRANTFDLALPGQEGDPLLENGHASLQKKHGLIRTLHESPAYDVETLEARVSAATDVMVSCGTRRVDTVVDVTTDRVGTTALRCIMGLAEARRDQIDIRAAAYNPLGFRDDAPERWNLFEDAATTADFIGALPEADDRLLYPERIGFEESLTRSLDLAKRLGTFIHVHLDQKNLPEEGATEVMLRVLDRDGSFSMPDGSPAIWAVHVISPSTYDEARFAALVEGLRAHNIGVISCPSCALSMRQLRGRQTPTYNSIARVLEFLAAGVRVRIGSDNVADMLAPGTTANLYDEILVLAAALRFYDIEILAKLASDTPLDMADRARLTAHLEQDKAEIDLALQTQSAVKAV